MKINKKYLLLLAFIPLFTFCTPVEAKTRFEFNLCAFFPFFQPQVVCTPQPVVCLPPPPQPIYVTQPVFVPQPIYYTQREAYYYPVRQQCYPNPQRWGR